MALGRHSQVIVGAVVVLIIVGGVSGEQRLDETPEGEWTFQRLSDEHVKIAHDGDEPVSTADLSVLVDSNPRSPSWSNASLTAGDFGVVFATEGSRIVLLWEKYGIEPVVLKEERV